MPAPRILVTGVTGFLGPFVVEALRARGADVVTCARSGGDAAVDLTAPGMVAAVAEALAPEYVVNLAAMASLALCEREPAAAARVNAELPERLAARFGPRLLHVSTDLVFDGRSAPYGEDAAVGPLSVYGSTKALGEEGVLRHGGRVVRLPLLFGPDGRGRGASASLARLLAERQPAALFTNEYRTPLHAADAALGLAELAPRADGPGVVHLSGPERLSRWEFGRRWCAVHGGDAALLRAVECQDPLRPRDVSLAGAWRGARSLAAMLADG